MINQNLRILIVEDLVSDTILLQRQFEKFVSEPEIRISDKLSNVRYALKDFIPDLVCTDYDLVGFTAIDVINAVKEIEPSTPIIVITGTLNNEELAANVILSGASGYLLKNDISNLHKRLEPLVQDIIVKKQKTLDKLNELKLRREELRRIHEILKSAARTDEKDLKLKEYYDKVIQDLDENISSFFRV
ncbi:MULTISPECIES: response regulator [Nonlabens]|uniref:response regulator n=1 Tax=Nonlabens TaxID=363408 RepID=UPI000CF520D7|nr:MULTISPECIES: response regulator [Nonlabens]PQJ20079.1 hypothetical protein BST93_01155 [Nonlabens tegetincola]